MVTGPVNNKVFVRTALLGPSFSRIIIGESSKSALRPADGWPEADFEDFPIIILPTPDPTVSLFRGIPTCFFGHVFFWRPVVPRPSNHTF